MRGSDARVSGEICHGESNSTGGATSSKGKAVWVVAEVGGVRSSDDPAPDLWFGQPAEERRDATCSAAGKRNEGRGDGPQGLLAPITVRELQIQAGLGTAVTRKGTRKAGCGKTACPV